MFISPSLIAIIFVAIILIVIIYVLHKTNKNLKIKIEIERERLAIINERYSKINKKNPTEKDLDNLDKLARDLFKEKDNMKYKLSYAELEKLYNNQNQNTKSIFCSKMSKIIYSEDSPTQKEILEVINIFSKIMDDFKLPKL